MSRQQSLVLVGFLLCSPRLFASDWTPLFNGNDLDGWVEHSGRAKYSVQDGMLVGETVTGSGNSFLCTTQTFGDFELQLEFKCDPLLNSGVQIRSEVFPDARTLNIGTNTFKLTADRVHGYQVEIDMDAARGRMWTAGIYDEARRGWLFPADGEKGQQGTEFSQQGRKVSKAGDWNKLLIRAQGATIKTWLNGEPRAEITDSLTPRGLVALQVHGVGNDASKAGLKVYFRNIRLRELTQTASESPANTLTEQEKQEGWRLLWDGKSSDGWRSGRGENFPARGWSIKDGVLTVTTGGDIITREKFSNFEFKADFKLTPAANSGIKYFVHADLNPATTASLGSVVGYEYQLLDDLLHPDAKAGRNGNRTLGSLYDVLPASKDKDPNPIGEWNTAHIIVRGNHVEHWLNDQKILEYDRTSPEFKVGFAHSKFHSITEFPNWTGGHILLQEHGNEVSFRNIKIRVLAEE